MYKPSSQLTSQAQYSSLRKAFGYSCVAFHIGRRVQMHSRPCHRARPFSCGPVQLHFFKLLLDSNLDQYPAEQRQTCLEGHRHWTRNSQRAEMHQINLKRDRSLSRVERLTSDTLLQNGREDHSKLDLQVLGRLATDMVSSEHNLAMKIVTTQTAQKSPGINATVHQRVLRSRNPVADMRL